MYTKLAEDVVPGDRFWIRSKNAVATVTKVERGMHTVESSIYGTQERDRVTLFIHVVGDMRDSAGEAVSRFEYDDVYMFPAGTELVNLLEEGEEGWDPLG